MEPNQETVLIAQQVSAPHMLCVSGMTEWKWMKHTAMP